MEETAAIIVNLINVTGLVGILVILMKIYKKLNKFDVFSFMGQNKFISKEEIKRNAPKIKPKYKSLEQLAREEKDA